MHATSIALTVVTLVVVVALLAWRRRIRSDARRDWQATSETNWSDEELDALRAADTAA